MVTGARLGPVLADWLWCVARPDRRLVGVTTLLIIAVVAGVGAGTYDSVAPGADRIRFRSALLRARHSLTDWDAAHEEIRHLPS